MAKKETKTENKEVKGLTQGAYVDVELIPTVSKRESRFNEMVEAIKSGKFYVLHEGAHQNSIYPMIHKLKEKGLDVVWSKVKAPDGTVQFTLFLKKE